VHYVLSTVLRQCSEPTTDAAQHLPSKLQFAQHDRPTPFIKMGRGYRDSALHLRRSLRARNLKNPNVRSADKAGDHPIALLSVQGQKNCLFG
jgi:hypothetical protein